MFGSAVSRVTSIVICAHRVFDGAACTVLVLLPVAAQFAGGCSACARCSRAAAAAAVATSRSVPCSRTSRSPVQLGRREISCSCPVLRLFQSLACNLRGGGVGEKADQVVIPIVRQIRAPGVAKLIRGPENDRGGAFTFLIQLKADIALRLRFRLARFGVAEAGFVDRATACTTCMRSAASTSSRSVSFRSAAIASFRLPVRFALEVSPADHRDRSDHDHQHERCHDRQSSVLLPLAPNRSRRTSRAPSHLDARSTGRSYRRRAEVCKALLVHSLLVSKILQQQGQPMLRPMQPHVDRVVCPAKHLGDLLHALFFQVKQHDHFAIILLQLRHGLADCAAMFHREISELWPI